MDRETQVAGKPQPTVEDDASLLALVQSGGEQAMATLYDRYSRVVYSVALRVLRDPASAEDALQEVFMQIWRNPSSCTAAGGFRGGGLAVAAPTRPTAALRRGPPAVNL